MRLSHLFTRTSKTVPHDADTTNARLLVQAGYVNQLMAGVYSYLPLGLRVLRNIESIVREEMNAIGGQEVLMPTLHPKANWETTGGWDKIDVLFKIQSRTGNEYALGQSEEEIVTPLILSRSPSYKELPLAVYQIHWKYRDELRAKSGIMRGREFLMKDMYSFHTSQEDFERMYQEAKRAYLKIFSRLGLTAKATEASGGSFSEKISYEFMVLTEAGEDDILCCERCDYGVNAEIAKAAAGDACPCGNDTLKAARASEVGNVFDLGTKYGKDFGMGYVDAEGVKQSPIMGCYGIGLSRVMGVIVETCHDERGIIWPESVAPFRVQMVSLRAKDEAVEQRIRDACESLERDLVAAGIDVLWDDRDDVTAGEKFSDADLLGMPVRLIVSEKTLRENAVEWKSRRSGETKLIKMTDLVEEMSR